MIAFLDTSTLVKLYHKELNSSKIMVSLGKIDNIYLSELSKIEFRSALWKKVRTKEIENNRAKTVISLFEADVDKFKWVNINSNLINKASNLLYRFGESGLRTLDSIQLATALTLKNRACLYYTEDKLLKKIFLNLELNVFDIKV